VVERYGISRGIALNPWAIGQVSFLAILATRRLEIEAPIMVLLTVLRAGVQIMTSNGKSQFNDECIFRISLTQVK
jgi:hypothetical protein